MIDEHYLNQLTSLRFIPFCANPSKDSVTMIFLPLLLFIAAGISAIRIEVREIISGRSISSNYLGNENLADLREKLVREKFPSNSNQWKFLDVKGKAIDETLEGLISVDRFKSGVGFIKIRADAAAGQRRVCLISDSKACNTLTIDTDITLTELRTTLKNTNSLKEGDCYDWRFIKSRNEIEYHRNIVVAPMNIIDKKSEPLLVVNNILSMEGVIYVANFYDINLETVHVVQQLEENEIRINPAVTLHWLRQVLSKNYNCPNSVWKVPGHSILPENDHEKWRVIVRNINTAGLSNNDKNSDLRLSIADEQDIKVNLKTYINSRNNKYIDFTNIKSERVDFVGMRCDRFTHEGGKFIIKVSNKYEADDKLRSIMLSNVRSVTDHNLIWENVFIAENGTALAFNVDRRDGRLIWVTITSDKEPKPIIAAKGNYFAFYADTSTDIVLAQNVIDTARDVRSKAQTVTVTIKTLKSFIVSNGNTYEWKGRHVWNGHLDSEPRRRRRDQSNTHISQDGINQAELIRGRYSDKNGMAGVTINDMQFDENEEARFMFYIFNFRSKEIAERLLDMQPADSF